MKKKVLVWLSGWVDSALSAALLLQQWYEVVWWFMKNYVSDKWNCTTFKDAEEAIKVAKFLWIELLSFDLQKEYQERIIDYIFEWYSRWITPNPDVLCNNLIKFDVFLNKSIEQWFDYIATGHYAKIKDGKLYYLSDDYDTELSFGYVDLKDSLKDETIEKTKFISSE